MAQVYANVSDRTNDLIRQLTTKDFDSAEELKENYNAGILQKGQEKVDEYLEKWRNVEDVSEKEIAGVVGLGGVYKLGKKAYDRYKSAKSKLDKENAPEDLEDPDKEIDEDGIDHEEVQPNDQDESTDRSVQDPSEEQPRVSSARPEDDPENYPEGSGGRVQAQGEKDDSIPEEEPSESGVQETSFMSSEPETVSQTIQGSTQAGGGDALIEPAEDATVKTASSLISDVAEMGTEGVSSAVAGATEAGSSIIGSVIGGLSATDIVPVLGEATLAISGVVALGDAIAHIFSPPPKPKVQAPDPTISNISLQSQLTSRYANAIPNEDSVDKPSITSLF